MRCLPIHVEIMFEPTVATLDTALACSVILLAKRVKTGLSGDDIRLRMQTYKKINEGV
jgi:hypothetical protein